MISRKRNSSLKLWPQRGRKDLVFNSLTINILLSITEAKMIILILCKNMKKKVLSYVIND